jgi:hypothetical protein
MEGDEDEHTESISMDDSVHVLHHGDSRMQHMGWGGEQSLSEPLYSAGSSVTDIFSTFTF